jgi:Cdc6-like AAA superfamily ATPase
MVTKPTYVDEAADKPTDHDLLKFERFVSSLATIIEQAGEKNTPLTIGVFGEWGSGKTSFLKMLEKVLIKRDKGINPIWFNAWKYEKEDNLWAALIQTIFDQAPLKGKYYWRIWLKFRIWLYHKSPWIGIWEIIRKIVVLLGRILLILISAWIILGVSTSDLQTWLTSFGLQIPTQLITIFNLIGKSLLVVFSIYLVKPEEILKLGSLDLGIDFGKFHKKLSYKDHISFLDQFNKNFTEIIQLMNNGRPLVVIIDDLDRCLPEKMLEVLEGVKKFLDVERCIFLIAVDPNIVEKAICIKYKEIFSINTKDDIDSSLTTFLGENYLEKIVQLPVSVPHINEEGIGNLIVSLYKDKDINLCKRIFTIGLPKNPRKVKRILYTFMYLRDLARKEIGKIEFKPYILAKIIILEQQYRGIYRQAIIDLHLF